MCLCNLSISCCNFLPPSFIPRLQDESEDYVAHMWRRVALMSKETAEQLLSYQNAIEALSVSNWLTKQTDNSFVFPNLHLNAFLKCFYVYVHPARNPLADVTPVVLYWCWRSFLDTFINKSFCYQGILLYQPWTPTMRYWKQWHIPENSILVFYTVNRFIFIWYIYYQYLNMT